MGAKTLDKKKRRENRKKKEEKKNDPLSPKRIKAGFDNAIINLSGDGYLRHFTNEQDHDIYILMERKLNISDDEIRAKFVSETVEKETKRKSSTIIRVSTKKKVVDHRLVKEDELAKIIVLRYEKEKNKFNF